MFNGTVSKQLLDQFDRIRELPQEVMLRIVVIYFTLVFLIVPDFVAGYLLMDDVFGSQELKIMENALFEGLVLGVVFLFAMSIIYAMSAGNRRMQYVVVGIAFCLVLFSGGVNSACGFASSAVGPFYCPADRQVYLDLQFFAELEQRFGAAGDFAQAYVIAHEVGHHVQTLLGISRQVEAARQRGEPIEGAGGLLVRQELQADCLAGVWAHHAQRRLDWMEEGDLEEALNAASAIGDDRLQKRTQGQVVPDSFTHGSSAQRVRWFRIGFDSGEAGRCDTFEAARL